MSYSEEEVLEIFREFHRLGSPLDMEADPLVKLKMSTTVDEWKRSGDLLKWKELAKALNKEFEIEVDSREWQKVLEPAGKRKLGDVCKLISDHAEKRIPYPVKLLGQRCESAGVFQFIKSELERRGVETAGLRPSSHLKGYLSDYYLEMLSVIVRLKSNTIESFEVVRKENKRSILHRLNVFDVDAYEVVPVDVVTFRDYVLKVV